MTTVAVLSLAAMTLWLLVVPLELVLHVTT
jgi:hypothetical protein